jgi:hypothetical protein
MDCFFALESTIAPELRPIIQDAAMNDLLAINVLWDVTEELGVTHPFEVGKAYYFETNTLYWCGRVVAVYPCWLKLDTASWVHWTGRKSVLLSKKSFKAEHYAQNDQKPRTEYVDQWTIAIGAISGFEEFDVSELPTTSLTG